MFISSEKDVSKFKRLVILIEIVTFTSIKFNHMLTKIPYLKIIS